MIINDNSSYSSEYIKQHKYSKYKDKNVYLLFPKLHFDIFTVVDEFIAKTEITSYIPADILSQIYKRQLILAIDLSTENIDRHIDIIYQRLIIDYGIPESQLLLISSSHFMYDYMIERAKLLGRNPCLFEYFFYYECVANFMLHQEFPNGFSGPLCRDRFDKTYLNFNRQWRYQRIALITLLYSKGLLDKGYNSFSYPHRLGDERLRSVVSYHPTLKIALINTGVEGLLWRNVCPNNTIDDLWYMWSKLTDEKFNDEQLSVYLKNGYDVYKKFPLVIDTNNMKRSLDFKREYNYSYNTILPTGAYTHLAHYFLQSYVSLVTETKYFNDQKPWISEKVLKPISFKQPFICVAVPGMLKYLKSLGYKTFHPFIDESYDQEINDSKRLLMICNEIERLSNFSKQELQNYKKGLLEIVEYNYNLLYNRTNFIA